MLNISPKLSVRGSIIRNKGYIFLGCIILAYLYAGFYASQDADDLTPAPVGTTLDGLTKTAGKILAGTLSKSVISEHPIPKLMERAEAQYREKLKKQSKTLGEAIAQYKRRYKRNPPKGFDQWWAFAKKNNVKLVDEFDGLMNDLEPFWQLSGQEIRRRTRQVGELPSIHLVRIHNGKSSTVKMNHAYEDSEVSARAHGFQAMMEQFEDQLPDMDFAINAKAEGRVLVSWEHVTHPNTSIQDSSKGLEDMLGGRFIPDWRGDGTIWEAWRRTCVPDTPARRLFSSLRNPFANQAKNYFANPSEEDNTPPLPGSEFHFVNDTNRIIDYCRRPYAHYAQGHFFSDWRSIPALYPVFTPAKAQGFMDIRIPSHYYYGSTPQYTYGWDPVNLELKNTDPMEVPWEQKKNEVFWRGATTGGGSHPPGFSPQYQRHRFLHMTSEHSPNVKRTITFEDPPNSGRFISTRVSAKDLNEELMDAAFVKAVAVETYPGGEKAIKGDHRFADSVPLGQHWSYKYLVDLDGMSYSGRFFAFLASDSVPLKATVYEEWFSDWIQPWVHFIPLSVSYKEIYNIVTYFSGPTSSTLLAANSTSTLSSLSTYSQAMVNTGFKDTRKVAMGSVDADRRLKRIARGGKQWKKSMGRKVDMEAYVYRLCIEWARLWTDDRKSMTL